MENKTKTVKQSTVTLTQTINCSVEDTSHSGQVETGEGSRFNGSRFNGLFHPIITKSYSDKCNINHMREQMLEDPAKREAWSAESSALIYTTGTLKLHTI